MLRFFAKNMTFVTKNLKFGDCHLFLTIPFLLVGILNSGYSEDNDTKRTSDGDS